MDLLIYKDVKIEHNRFLPIIYKMLEIAEYDNLIITRFRKIFNVDLDTIKSYTSSFSRFTGRLYVFCKRYAEYFEVDVESLKGDLFEIFVEIFLKTNGNNEKVLINNYNVIHSEADTQDIGVDGVGYDMNNEPCTIQIKYRNHSSPVLTTASITQFIGASLVNYNIIPKNESKSFVLITNTKRKVDYRINKIANNRLKVIDGNIFDVIIGSSQSFWLIMQFILSNNYNKFRNVNDCRLVIGYDDLFLLPGKFIYSDDLVVKNYEERKWNIFEDLK